MFIYRKSCDLTKPFSYLGKDLTDGQCSMLMYENEDREYVLRITGHTYLKYSPRKYKWI
jgi:hypothetical protein